MANTSGSFARMRRAALAGLTVLVLLASAGGQERGGSEGGGADPRDRVRSAWGPVDLVPIYRLGPVPDRFARVLVQAALEAEEPSSQDTLATLAKTWVSRLPSSVKVSDIRGFPGLLPLGQLLGPGTASLVLNVAVSPGACAPHCGRPPQRVALQLADGQVLYLEAMVPRSPEAGNERSPGVRVVLSFNATGDALLHLLRVAGWRGYSRGSGMLWYRMADWQGPLNSETSVTELLRRESVRPARFEGQTPEPEMRPRAECLLQGPGGECTVWKACFRPVTPGSPPIQGCVEIRRHESARWSISWLENSPVAGSARQLVLCEWMNPEPKTHRALFCRRFNDDDEDGFYSLCAQFIVKYPK